MIQKSFYNVLTGQSENNGHIPPGNQGWISDIPDLSGSLIGQYPYLPIIIPAHVPRKIYIRRVLAGYASDEYNASLINAGSEFDRETIRLSSMTELTVWVDPGGVAFWSASPPGTESSNPINDISLIQDFDNKPHKFVTANFDPPILVDRDNGWGDKIAMTVATGIEIDWAYLEIGYETTE